MSFHDYGERGANGMTSAEEISRQQARQVAQSAADMARRNAAASLKSASTADLIDAMKERGAMLTAKLEEADAWRTELTEIQAMLHALTESRKRTSDE